MLTLTLRDVGTGYRVFAKWHSKGFYIYKKILVFYLQLQFAMALTAKIDSGMNHF